MKKIICCFLLLFLNGYGQSYLTAAANDSDKYPIIKDDFIINNFEGGSGAAQIIPKIAMDGNGNHAVAWYDFRNGSEEIYIQFYDSDNKKIAGNIRVSNSNEPINEFLVSASDNGWFLVIWVSGTQLLAQKFSPVGIKSGNVFTLKATYGISKPTVAIESDGSFLATWYYHDYNGWRLVVQHFNKENNPTGTVDVLSNEFPGYIIDNYNNVAVDDSGNFVVTWHNLNNIYLQKIKRDGEKSGETILVSELSDNRSKNFPSICSTSDGHFLICWTTLSAYGEKTVTGRVYNINANLFTNAQKDYVSSYYCYSYPVKKISTDRVNNFYLQSESDKNYIWKISKTGERIRIHHNFHTTVKNDLSINRDIISNTYQNSFYIVSTIQSKTNYDIGIEKYDTTVAMIDSITTVNDDTLSTWQYAPKIYTNEQGYSIVVWVDGRTSVYSLFAQVLDPEFNSVGTNILVSNEEFSSSDNKLDIKSLSDGTFIIGCITGPIENRKIFLQAITTSGEKGTGKYLNTLNRNSYNIALNINANDEIKVCWYNSYDASTIKLNNEFQLVSPLKYIYLNSKNKDACVLSINNNLDMLFSWLNKKYSNEGKLYINNLLINDSGESKLDSVDISYYSPYSLINQLDNDKNVMLSWLAEGRLNIMRIYPDSYSFIDYIGMGYYYTRNILQKAEFNNRKGRIVFVDENILKVATFNDNKEVKTLSIIGEAISPESKYEGGNSLDLSLIGDKLITIYDSPKNGETGMDIWSNVRQFEEIDFDKEVFYAPVNDDFLYNNYPNPFNSGTTIAYRLLAYHHVKLTVYDILGREVAILVDEPQEKGVYEVDFNSTGLASGVYFYKLESFRTSVKKMIILK